MNSFSFCSNSNDPQALPRVSDDGSRVPLKEREDGGDRYLTSLPSEHKAQPASWQESLSAALDCSGKAAEVVQQSQRLVTVTPGTDIFVQASAPKAIYLLLTGTAHMIGSLGQREARMGTIIPGMLCDPAACILNAPHNYTARSVTSCDLATLPIAIWQKLIEEFPSVSMKAASQISSDLRGVVKQIASR